MKTKKHSFHHKKLVSAAVFAAGLSVLFSADVFAGSWLNGQGENAGRLWYQNDDSSWLANGWYLVEDAARKSGWYRFDADGWQVEGPLETLIPEAVSNVISEAEAAFANAELVAAIPNAAPADADDAAAAAASVASDNASVPEADSSSAQEASSAGTATVSQENSSSAAETVPASQESSSSAAEHSSSDSAGPGTTPAEDSKGADLGPAIVEMMRSFEGRGIVPYVNGGRSLSGADCGSFIHLIFEMFDMDLPWIPTDMYNAGRKISQDELMPGDFIFFTKNGGASISHVAVYAGEVNGDKHIVHMTNSARNGVFYDRLADMYASGTTQYYGAVTFLH